MANGDDVVSNKQIIFRDYISGFPKETDMILSTMGTIRLKVPEGSNSIMLKNLYLSCDPYMRPITGFAVSEVLDSGNPNFKKGDYVSGFSGWEQYSLIDNPDPLSLIKINYTDFRIHLSGIFNLFYKSQSIRSPSFCLTKTKFKYFPKGNDIYFENVGGKMLEAVLQNMAVHGRITHPEGVHNLTQLVLKRVRMEGFNVFDHYHLYPEFMELMKQYFMDEKLVYVEDMVEGFENAPAALIGLFTGRNIGKQVVKVSHE
ncbi:hypothetical protein MKX01_017761 [Papaver californicum]|nr:hypothetical protein MKX01_017761 [Papaver californicum]